MAILLAAIAAGAWVAWKRPALALVLFVIGFAVHNAVLMALVQMEVPVMAIRAIQAWKEAYVGLLFVRLTVDVSRAGGYSALHGTLRDWTKAPLTVRALDLAAAGFGLVLVVYLSLPSDALTESSPSLGQRLLSFRTLLLIPVLYLFGRKWPPRVRAERRAVIWVIVGTAAVVSVVGLVELWFVPTHVWLDWGIREFNAFQGFRYEGPGGLPENFFQSTSAGFGLRRMVSTYLSPLGIAYTGLLVVPLAVSAGLNRDDAPRWTWVAFALLVVSIALALTRLALLCLAVEAIVLAFVLRQRTATIAAGFALAAAAAAIVVYPNFGPVVTYDLGVVRPPLGASALGIVPGERRSSGLAWSVG